MLPSCIANKVKNQWKCQDQKTEKESVSFPFKINPEDILNLLETRHSLKAKTAHAKVIYA
jgi:hypothetical protein